MILSTNALIKYIPRPVLLGAMGPMDADGAWLIDATSNMKRRNTVIVLIGNPTLILRQDGKTLTDQDPEVSPGVIQSAGYQWSFSVTTRGNCAFYYLGFELTLASGDLITRWFELPVQSRIG